MHPLTYARLPAYATAFAFLALTTLPVAAHDPVLGVDPPHVAAALPPGSTYTVDKTVHTPIIPPQPDIVFLADTSGSMTSALNDVKADVQQVINDIRNSQPDARFGVAQYEDFDCPDSAFGYNLDLPLSDNDAAVQAAVNTWTVINPNEGCDVPEAQVNGLYQVASDAAVGFRPDSTRIIAWFGDASGHDPSNGHSLADAIAALQGSGDGIRVVAVDVQNGFGDGLDATGQATQVTDATGGVLLASGDDVSGAILSGIEDIEVTVSPAVGPCDPSLALAFAPGSETVESGEDAHFAETISVAPDAPQGSVVHCTVAWLIDGNVVTGADGQPDPAFMQHIDIAVTDVTPPTATCEPTANPAGGNSPTSKSSASSGQNADGFYVLKSGDNVDGSPDIYLEDTGSGTVFGPFDSGTTIKYTQAPGATPGITPMTGTVEWKITGTGDAVVYAVDDSGNTSASDDCLVPGPPK